MRNFLLTILMTACLAMPAASSEGLTIPEIEGIWGDIGTQTGTFTQTNADGSVMSGSFRTDGPTLITLEYTRNGQAYAAMALNGRTRDLGVKLGRFSFKVDSNGYTFVDGYEAISGRLGPFAALLKADPAIEQVVTGTGANQNVTTFRVRHPVASNQGYVDVTFSNAGKLRRWDSHMNGEHTVTTFNY